MQRAPVLFLILALFALSMAAGQAPFPVPPQPADKTPFPHERKTPPPHTRQTDSVQLQRDARELSDLAKSIPPDIEHVNQGLLPKDTIEKLKRIEKLSKHLRSELTP